MQILPGLTGIVGPNGCGKSNLVEALRWVMGESSSKRLRGGEMDDVIFAGAAGRPPRNQAEVSLRLANPDLDAPLQFNDATVLEVTRKIMRGQGSSYRVNGREHRAQDLKLLFADLASGASSNAMVAQGRVAAIVNARPTDRRALLEEAAGITGLYSRRREAENRLRAAEANLERVDDLQQAKSSQRRSLERQAAAAARYAALQDERRSIEAALTYREWQRVEADLVKANAALAKAEGECERLMVEESAAQRAEDAANDLMEPTRLAHAEAAARRQRIDLALEALASEERGLEAKRADLTRQLAQSGDDLEREQGGVEAATQRLERLAEEEASLKKTRAMAKPEVARLEQELAAADARERAAGETLREAALRLSTARNERKALTTRIEALDARASTLASKLATLSEGRAFDGADEAAIAGLIADQEAAQGELEALQGDQESLLEAKSKAQEARTAGEEAARSASKALSQAEAEREGLAALLTKQTRGSAGQTLAQVLQVQAGFGPQVAAALASGMDAALNDGQGDHWRARSVPDAPALPANLASLQDAVTAPDWLPAILAYVGVAQDAAQAAALQADLLPGQALTTAQGGLWRWDGLVIGQEQGAQSAAWIERQQRLSALDHALPDLRAAVAAADQRLNQVQQAIEVATAQEREQAQRVDAHRRALQAKGQTIMQAQRALAEHRTKVAHQEAERAGTTREQETVAAERDSLEKLLADQGSLEVLETAQQTASSDHSAAQDAVRQARNTLETAKRELISCDARLGAILTENFTFEGQLRNAKSQLEVLEQRAKTLEAESLELADKPVQIAAKRAELSTAKQEAEVQQATAGDKLAEAEVELREARNAHRAVMQAHGEARERRARLAAEQAAAQERIGAVARQAYEKFKRPAADLLELTGKETPDELPKAGEAEQTLRRLERQIDQIGPVNLAAENQVKELAEELEDLQRETSELTKAIAKLRKVIQELNQEGRQRLKIAFDQVASHFGSLFQRLFGGGKARLELVGSDDPLEAGLEIFASPPGKRLQSLTLLSGGEQTLTALALIFAMFRANPAPLCVLDEVDAPLDDANVDRMCGLLEDMAAEVGTRFLVVTHNALTMARVNRLFGVTMAEKGVSRLVSVDLQDAVQYQDG